MLILIYLIIVQIIGVQPTTYNFNLTWKMLNEVNHLRVYGCDFHHGRWIYSLSHCCIFRISYITVQIKYIHYVKMKKYLFQRKLVLVDMRILINASTSCILGNQKVTPISFLFIYPLSKWTKNKKKIINNINFKKNVTFY